MRIWDIMPEKLCRNHLLGEHRELHAIWTILTQCKKGYSQHPEVIRWKGRLKALHLRHEALVRELNKREYQHNSPLSAELAMGRDKQTKYINTHEEQIAILRKKCCGCKV